MHSGAAIESTPSRDGRARSWPLLESHDKEETVQQAAPDARVFPGYGDKCLLAGSAPRFWRAPLPAYVSARRDCALVA